MDEIKDIDMQKSFKVPNVNIKPGEDKRMIIIKNIC